jgi:hypothetical protein
MKQGDFQVRDFSALEAAAKEECKERGLTFVSCESLGRNAEHAGYNVAVQAKNKTKAESFEFVVMPD